MPEVRGGKDASERRASRFFDDLWSQGDYWKLETSPFERRKYSRQVELLGPRTYGRALEIGCGAGAFTELLSERADQVLALDVSRSAIERALRKRPRLTNVEFRAADVMELEFAAAPGWDLITLSETIYYLGWLHSFFDVAWLAGQIFEATSAGGRFLMANTLSSSGDYLLRPWMILTYRDLFSNVGYVLEHEEIVTGVKDGANLETLVSLFGKRDD